MAISAIVPGAKALAPDALRTPEAARLPLTAVTVEADSEWFAALARACAAASARTAPRKS